MLAHLRSLRFTQKKFAFRSFHNSKINDHFLIAFIRNGLQERLDEKQMERNADQNIENDDDCGRTFPALDDYDIFDAETKLIFQESMAINHKKTVN